MKERRAARRLAVDVLYEAEIRDALPAEVLASHAASGFVSLGPEDEEGPSEPPNETVVSYARTLAEGVQAHQAEIDKLITDHADRWAIQRMPVIDRTILRIALFELLFGGEVPVPVAINEAVEMAKTLSTEDSGRFINGMLGRIAETDL